MNGTFVSVAEATAVIEQMRVVGSHPLIEVRGEDWLWRDPAPNGHGPALSFCEAVYGDTPQGMSWVCTCGADGEGCVRPSHYTVMRDSEERPAGRDLNEFARRIRQERMAWRDTRALARAIGVARSTVEAWERGESYPGPKVEERLARKFGWDGKPRKWIVTVVFQSVEVTDSAGAAAEQALRPLEREGLPVKAVIHNVTAVA